MDIQNQNINDDFIVLCELPELSPSGTNSGTISELRVDTGTDQRNKSYRELVVSVTLDKKRSDGSSFVLERRYNTARTGRGMNMFSADYELWTGNKLPADQIARFRPTSVKGLPVKVEVTHTKVGKNYSDHLKCFLPHQTEAA